MKQAQKTSRVLIADGSLLFCRGLRTVLDGKKDLQVIETAITAEETLAKARLLRPDVLVMDVQLLNFESSHLITSLRQAMANASMLVLTEEDNQEFLACAIQAGATGYMLKSSSPAHLVAGVCQIAFSNHSDPVQISKIIPDLKALSTQSENKTFTSALTGRECEVVRLLAEGKTVRETACELSLSIKTIEAHKLNLMRKLDIHDRTALIAYAVRQGLVQTANC